MAITTGDYLLCLSSSVFAAFKIQVSIPPSPWPPDVFFYHPRTLGWLGLQPCSPAQAQHSKELPNSKPQLLRNGLGWGLSIGASSNILFMGISRKNCRHKWE